MTSVYFGLGGNIEPRLEYLSAALVLLGEYWGERAFGCSRVWESAGWGFLGEVPDFLNMVVRYDLELGIGGSAGTDWEAVGERLLAGVGYVERVLGRCRTGRGGAYESRVIDVDVLLVGDHRFRVGTSGEGGRCRLEVPHPLMRERLFVLRPLVEVAGPDGVDPVSGRSWGELLALCRDGGALRPY